ncbi:MAG: GNAT family N-acetyltransferase [Oscillospiraceae bacterium]|nr:GNAT family N-acetyltransferase [Oscillospiraceae bacterium]
MGPPDFLCVVLFLERAGAASGPAAAGKPLRGLGERVCGPGRGANCGFCTLLKTDYYPENRYFPWISTIFVEEPFRGRRISHRMIEAAAAYAKSVGFARVYIPSDMTGFYEKCGFQKIDELENYGGDRDNIFAKEI